MFLIAAILITALLAILGHYRDKKILTYIFKPLTTILIILLAVYSDTQSLYARLIIAGLVFSLAGDVFLMLPSDQFIAGLVSFLIAHLIYIAAFMNGHPPAVNLALMGIMGILGVMLAGLIIPHAGEMKIPVTVYMTVILAMAYLAWERWFFFGTPQTLLAAAGSAVFIASDFTLAFNRFRKPFKSAEGIVLGTYWVAQVLIAVSIE